MHRSSVRVEVHLQANGEPAIRFPLVEAAFAFVRALISLPVRLLGGKASCKFEQADLRFLGLFRPGIFQCDRAIEDELPWRAVFVQSEITEAFELITQIAFGVFQ